MPLIPMVIDPGPPEADGARVGTNKLLLLLIFNYHAFNSYGH
jgi:hypothetical protein